MITVRSTINIAHQSVPNVIPVVQGDTGRSILFSLADFTIPTGATARYFITKPSGLAVYNDATIDGNTVLVDLTAQSLAEYGDCPGQVRISVGQTVVTSFEFILHVEPFRGIDAVESTTETNIFDKAVEDAREAIAEAAEEAEEYISQALDTTLTIPDKAADAKATGDAISDSADAVIAQMRAEIANVYPTETAQGNPATFDDGADNIPVKDLKATIVPTQDLHGYDKPWPGGGWKNLLPTIVSKIKTANSFGTWSGNSYSFNGLTFSILTDSDDNVTGITVNGTASANVIFTIWSGSTFSSGKYELTGCPAGGSSNTYQLQLATDDMQFFGDYGDGVRINSSGSSIYCAFRIVVGSGTSVTDKVFNPMFRLYESSDATFVPYSNLCPISGMTDVEVERTGFNQWDEQWEIGYINTSTGADTPANDAIRSKGYIKVIPGVTYFFNAPNFDTLAKRIRIYTYDSSHAFLEVRPLPDWASGNTYGIGRFTAPANCSAIRFTAANLETPATYNHDICINIFDAAKNGTYEPYRGKQTVTTDLDRTVYGGTLDVTTGVLTVVWATVDLGTLSWAHRPEIGTGIFASQSITDYMLTATVGAMCAQYAYVGTVNSIAFMLNYDNAFSFFQTVGSTTRVLYARDTSYTDAATFKTAMSGVQLVYELATPQTYQLTPQELLSVLGTNHISTDAESVEVVYRQDIGLILKRMSDSLLPYLPLTRDGIYDLKAEVTGGEKFLYWWTQAISMMSSARPMQTPIADDEPLEEEPVEEEFDEEITPEEDEED